MTVSVSNNGSNIKNPFALNFNPKTPNRLDPSLNSSLHAAKVRSSNSIDDTKVLHKLSTSFSYRAQYEKYLREGKSILANLYWFFTCTLNWNTINFNSRQASLLNRLTPDVSVSLQQYIVQNNDLIDRYTTHFGERGLIDLLCHIIYYNTKLTENDTKIINLNGDQFIKLLQSQIKKDIKRANP